MYQTGKTALKDVGRFLAQSPQAMEQLLAGLRRVLVLEKERLDFLAHSAVLEDSIRKDALVAVGRYNMLQDIVSEFEYAKKVVAQ